MLPLISVVLLMLSALGLKRLLPVIRKRRRQVRFIREVLASSRKSDGRRVIASLSTVPERIGNLGPTIRSLLRQTRPPDEIVVAVPEYSIREQRSYVVPKYVSRWPRLRASRAETHSGNYRVRKLLDPTEVLRRIALGLFPSAAGSILHGRYLDQWLSHSSQREEIRCACVGYDAERVSAAADFVAARCA